MKDRTMIILFVAFCFCIVYIILRVVDDTAEVQTTMKDVRFSERFCDDHGGPMYVRRNKYGLQITCQDRFIVENLRPYKENK